MDSVHKTPGGLKSTKLPEGAYNDIGAGTAASLYDRDMSLRQRYADPVTFKAEELPDATSAERDLFYKQGPYPAKYDVPTEDKERMATKQYLAASRNAQHVVPITDADVEYVRNAENQRELANFDRYISMTINPREPGALKHLMEIYPEYVQRRVQQVNRDFEYACKNKLIDMWGANTLEELHFKYMVDQGYISGPELMERADAADMYNAGYFSPFRLLKKPQRLRAPFASAKTGIRPDNANDWTTAGVQPFTSEQALRTTKLGTQEAALHASSPWGGAVAAGENAPVA